jgi:hypothetical protein
LATDRERPVGPRTGHLSDPAGGADGGRSRVFTDDAERARVSVRKAIGRALAGIADVDGDLAGPIDERLVTGHHCTFHAETARR